MRVVAARFALVLGACAPDGAGLIVRAVPGDGVRAATELHVYVGYEDLEQERRQLPAIHRHKDDARNPVIRLTESFDGPVDILLEGHEERPMWIAVRAVEDGRVLGEGGYPRAVTQPTDHVERAVIDVTAGTIEGNRGCPGFFDDAGVPHYIVPEPNTADCDRDDVAEGADCDDFDREVKPGAIDAVCDGVDLDCAAGSATILATCAGYDVNNRCVLGTSSCDDENQTQADCLVPVDSGVEVPIEVCNTCLGLTGAELIDCVRPFAHEVWCDVEYTAAGFCQDTGTQLDPWTWAEDQGASTPALGFAAWSPLPSGVEYGWAEGSSWSTATSTAWPPSPSVRTGGPSALVDRRDLELVVSKDPNGTLGLTVVELRFDREDSCDLDGPDCSEPFPP